MLLLDHPMVLLLDDPMVLLVDHPVVLVVEQHASPRRARVVETP